MPLFYIIVLIIGIAVGALTGITGSSGVLVVVPVLSYMGINFRNKKEHNMEIQMHRVP